MSLNNPAEALNLDLNQQISFVKYFNELPEKPKSTLRFFNHTDYFTLHGPEDTKIASDFTKNPVKLMGATESKLPYVVLRKTQFEQLIRELLLVRQYRIEVYTKVSNRINDWKQECKASPGNLGPFEEILFENNDTVTFSNYAMGIHVKGKQIALACVSITELQILVCEMEDTDLYTELETILAQVNPRECVLSTDDKTLRNVLERNGVLVAQTKRSDFNSENVVQDLNRLLFFAQVQERNALNLPETGLNDAMSAVNAVIKFLNLTSDPQNFNQYKLSKLESTRFVRIDNAALYSLNILPKNNKDFCLRSVLDRCTTNQGKRLLDQWLKQPLKDVNLIEERLNIVEAFIIHLEVRELTSKVLSRLPDLLLLSKKISGQKATLQDCYKVYQIVCAIPELIEMLHKLSNPHVESVLIDPLDELNTDLDKYRQMVEEVIDLDLVDRHEFLVKRTFCPELTEIYERKTNIEEKMQIALQKASKALDKDGIKLECNDQYGFFFRVTLKDDQTVRKNAKFTVLDANKLGGLRFTNDTLSALNKEYEAVKAVYEEQQTAVLKELLEVAAGYGQCLRALNIQTATVDTLLSFAKISIDAKIPYVRPKLHPAGTGVMNLANLRHPCIEQQDRIAAFIPNSVEFDAENTTLHIITGPNMCGKSTFIRSVGICALMAQIGCFVPCFAAELSVFDAILARVGAEDCLLKGLSTFMLEMIETASIVETATANSLVIIDELGRGTSTYDGCGIAFAIAEHLAREIGCFALFATHFHEITRLAEMQRNVGNLHVTAVTTQDSITPLYQVKQGACDNSYGIHCARMVEFPQDVIESAVKHQQELEHAQGTQFIKDYEPELKRSVIKEGDAILDEALKTLSSGSKTMSDAELLAKMKEFKSELDQSDNLFIKGLLAD